MDQLLIENLSLSYGNTKVLNDINLSVDKGEFLVLVGPSGSGKSTLLRSVAGLEEPSSGEIIIANDRVTKFHPKNRNIAMVFQNYALYPHMSVYDNLSFPLKLKKLSNVEIKSKVLDTSKLLGVEKYLDKKPKQLSGGERQRVALGRAIVRDPDLFLMDEPLSNLDAKLRTHMRAELLKLHASLNATIVYVTHDQVEAMTMGSRIAVLNEGTIQQLGSPREIYDSPENIFVASFIGTPQINIFDYLPGLFPQLDKLSLDFKASGVETVAIRPEKLYLDPSGLSVQVELIELLGSEYVVHSNLKFRDMTFPVTFKLPDIGQLKQGDRAKVSFSSDDVLFFNSKGQRVRL